MKCNAYILYYKKPKKNGSKRVYCTLKPKMSLEEILWTKRSQINLSKSVEDVADFSRLGICDGEIFAKISCHDEPDYNSDHYAELDVEFKCSKCKHTYYPELPNKYNINDWINKILMEMK